MTACVSRRYICMYFIVSLWLYLLIGRLTLWMYTSMYSLYFIAPVCLFSMCQYACHCSCPLFVPVFSERISKHVYIGCGFRRMRTYSCRYLCVFDRACMQIRCQYACMVSYLHVQEEPVCMFQLDVDVSICGCACLCIGMQLIVPVYSVYV